MSAIGPGLDVAAIVDGLMQAQMRNINQMTNEQKSINTKITAYTQLSSLTTSFADNLANLQSVLVQNLYNAQSTNESILSAVTTSQFAAPGTYSINVTQLAQANQVSSSAFATATDALNMTGTLTLGVGSSSASITLNPTDALQDIRDNINDVSAETGVSASILRSVASDGSSQYQILLTSAQTGVANTINISGDGLSELDFTNQITAAQNAQFTINGIYTESSSNLVSDVLDGVTLNLNGQLGTASLNILPDTATQQANVEAALTSFVDTYNSIVQTLAQYDATRGVRDGTFGLLQLSLERAMQQTVGTGTMNSLLSMGVELSPGKTMYMSDGSPYYVRGMLSIDSTQLNTALSQNMDDIEAFFTGGTSNFSTMLQSTLDGINNISITQRQDSLHQQDVRLEQRIDQEQSRLDSMRESLMKRYSALDVYIARYDQIGAFLDEQIDIINSNHRK